MSGPQVELVQMLSVTPFDTKKDFDDYIARLNAVPKYIDQTISLLEEGIRINWVQPYEGTRCNATPLVLPRRLPHTCLLLERCSDAPCPRSSVGSHQGERAREHLLQRQSRHRHRIRRLLHQHPLRQRRLRDGRERSIRWQVAERSVSCSGSTPRCKPSSRARRSPRASTRHSPSWPTSSLPITCLHAARARSVSGSIGTLHARRLVRSLSFLLTSSCLAVRQCSPGRQRVLRVPGAQVHQR